MNLEDKYKIYTEKCLQAELGGGEERIAKQHAEAKKTSAERIIYLLDPDTFV